MNDGVSPDRSANDSTYTATITAPAGVSQLAITVSASAPGESSTSQVFTFPVNSPPVNDDFANATPLAGMNVSVTGNNVYASKEPGEPNHAGNAGGRSVWWTWTAPSGGSVTINTFGSSFDTLLAVYTGSSVSALTPVASNDDFSNTMQTSQVTFSVTAGTIYQIAIDGFDGQCGDCTLSLAMTPYSAPSVSVGPALQMAVAGSDVNISASFAGLPTPTALWQTSWDNGATWSNLTNGGQFSASNTGTLTVLAMPLFVAEPNTDVSRPMWWGQLRVSRSRCSQTRMQWLRRWPAPGLPVRPTGRAPEPSRPSTVHKPWPWIPPATSTWLIPTTRTDQEGKLGRAGDDRGRQRKLRLNGWL